VFTGPSDAPFAVLPGTRLITILARDKKRAMLRSPSFELSGPVELRLQATLSTFGSRLYICPDERLRGSDNAGRGLAAEVDDCELLSGPRVLEKRTERLSVQLDPNIRHFMIVALHDNYEEFGEAEFTISRVEVSDLEGNLICHTAERPHP